MWPKLFIVVFCLYVVKASVLPCNSVSEDVSNDIEATQKASCGCRDNECNNHCRQRGYSWGECVNNDCQCHYQKTQSADLKGDAVVNPEVSEARLEDCSWRQCDWHCHQMGYADGTCVNGRCQCNGHRPAMPSVSAPTTKTDSLVKPQVSEARLEDCNWRQCDWQCQQMGYPDGRCLNGHCQCNSHRPAMPTVSSSITKIENTLNDNLATLTDGLMADEEENPELSEAELEDCNWNWCDQHCRNMGYSYGRCINGQCRCDGHHSAIPTVPVSLKKIDALVNPEVSEAKLEDCTWRQCDWHCQQMGYLDGRCVNGRCQCYRHRPAMPTVSAPTAKIDGLTAGDKVNPELSEAKLEDCNWNWCMQHCRNLGYLYGRCENGQCDCVGHRSAISTVPVSLKKIDALVNPEVSEAKLEVCTWRQCDWHCQQMGYLDGRCVNGRCQCYDHRPATPTVSAPTAKIDGLMAGDKVDPELSEAKLEDCNWSWCYQHCRDMGYSYGRCINGRCQCNGHRSATPTVPVSLTKIDALVNSEESEAKLEDCTWRQCDWHCQQMGYLDGRCVNGRCQCYNQRPSTPTVSAPTAKIDGLTAGDKVNPELSEAKLEDCNWNWCRQHCRNMGYSYGRCVNGHCQCSGVHSEMPTVPVSLSKIDSLVNSEESEASLEDCNSRWCNWHCHQMGYLDGGCVNGRCQCNGHRPTMSTVSAPVTKTEKPELSEAKLEDCNWNWCDQHCRSIGYPNGRCINGQCRCNSPRASMPTVPVSLTKIGNILEHYFLNPTKGLVAGNGVNPEVSQDCTWRWCDQHCRQMGYSYGRCVNGRCQCERRPSEIFTVPALFTKLDNEETSGSRAERSCNANSCLQFCRRLGFRFSRCYNGNCNCFR